jgi:hypothetical protein
VKKLEKAFKQLFHAQLSFKAFKICKLWQKIPFCIWPSTLCMQVWCAMQRPFAIFAIWKSIWQITEWNYESQFKFVFYMKHQITNIFIYKNTGLYLLIIHQMRFLNKSAF